MRILVAGAAGLVGQNLIPKLKADPACSILAIDKHPQNTKILRKLHPEIDVLEADLADPGAWVAEARQCDVAVMLQAQIGGLEREEFTRNNITSTNRILEAVSGGSAKYLCHISSSVVNSKAVDLYTESKKAQEEVVAASSITHVVLRPTLMFGWFDRKHLGWLRRFMDRSAVFPIPGHGRYPRQPLYAGDFSSIVASTLQSGITGSYNISGLAKIDYIDLIRAIKEVTKARASVIKIPYTVFAALLAARATFDRNPPFTTTQLKALVIPETFEVIDWPGIFGVKATPLRDALDLTFNHPVYSKVTLTF
ncbi:MAG: NAD-dependent epimerase/dehydratase family protein [Hyphomonadaceae bacterium]|nr:NAD-dependent epimerase/dehydratase family protein [Hyphomonadaceae bacterium]